MAHDVFISYSHEDKIAADAVCSIMEKNGIRCWIAPRDITPGIPFAEAIIDGIKDSKVFILVYSSDTNKSQQVIREVDRAVHHGLAIIPLRLDDVPMSKQLEYYISNVHWLDALTLPLEKHINRLCQVVKSLLTMDKVDSDNIREAFSSETIRQAEQVSIVEEKEKVRAQSNEVREGEKNVLQDKSIKLPGKKLAITLLAVGALLTIATLIVYLKISGNRSSLNAMTLPVTVTNEIGEKDVRRVFKDSYITRLAIYPFDNEANDSAGIWLKYGLLHAIRQDLRQFNYIIVGSDINVTHLQEQLKNAKADNYPNFLTGTFRMADSIYVINTKLYQTENGTIVADRIFRGIDLFSIIDSISLQARIDLGISKTVLNSSPDLPFREHSTNNLNAFRYMITGLYMESTYTNLQRSIELDSTFAHALYIRAGLNYAFQESIESAQKDINQAMRHRQRLSEFDNFSTRSLYYLIRGEIDKAVALSEMQHELNPRDAFLLLDLIGTYESYFMIHKKYEKAIKQLNELVPNDPYCLKILARSYLFTGELNKGLEVLKKMLENSTEDVDALLQMGEIYLHKNDLETAEKIFQKAILIQPENEMNWSKIFDYIDYSRKHQIENDFLNPLTGNYRFETGELTFTFFIHNNHLIGKAKNQLEPGFCYPVSDTKFISDDGIYAFTFIRNTRDEVIKVIFHDPYDQSYTLWKEDSLICRAMNLLNENKSKALYAFREAYAGNPDHYYLASFIRYLEFIQSEAFESIKPAMETYIGNYGDMIIFKEDDNFYFKGVNGFMFKLLPLSEDRFIAPSFYNEEFQIIKKNKTTEGLKIIYRDGKEKFLLKIG